jgi:transcriptional regulator GlxA family with amidase domain
MAPIRLIGFLVFPRLTLLDLIGPYDALRRVKTMGIDPALRWTFLGTTLDPVDDSGTRVHVDDLLPPPPLRDIDLLVVPGGFGVDELRASNAVREHLATWPAERPIASVCSGSLLLGDAGLLRDRRATTHHGREDQLRPLCAEVVTDQRVVDTGNIVTAAGVTSGIDLGLHLVARFWGDAARDRIAAQMEWR